MTKETIARYEIRSELGRGGMAAVYLAYDPNFRRNVAIKLISVNLHENPVFRERFEREARLIAQVEHPAIVPVYDFGEQDDQLYLVMRYMGGGTLASKMREGKSTLGYAVKLISQIAPALDAVHAQNVVHRDLKPGNILLDGFGNPAISDFGIAHLTAITTDLTGSAIIGTPSYMSPEQVRSDPDLDGRSDVYSLGVILFEMLTGHGPFHATTPLSVALKHLTDPVPSILSLRPDLPPEIESVLSQALAKDKEQRYQSASDMARDLQAVLDKYPGSANSLPTAKQASRNEDAATEVDTGESLSAAAYSPNTSKSNTSQPVSIRQTSTSASLPKRPLQIFLGTSLGLVLLVVCVFVGLIGIWVGLNGSGLFSGQNPVVTSTPIKVSETILFADNFSDPASGWPIGRNAQSKYGYQSNSYRILATESGSVPWVSTDQVYKSLSISVDARPASDHPDSYYGLLCRIQDNNFYYFVIQPDGNYTIGKYKNGEFNSFFPDGWRYSAVIKQRDQTNHIKADCLGNTLRLYANGTLLGTATDTDFGSGSNGMIVATLDTQNFEVIFDNFLITTSGQ